jgi:hypothetical protein
MNEAQKRERIKALHFQPLLFATPCSSYPLPSPLTRLLVLTQYIHEQGSKSHW